MGRWATRGTFSQRQEITGGDSAPGDFFGYAVALDDDGDTAAVSTPFAPSLGPVRLTGDAVGGARGIRTLDPSCPGYRISSAAPSTGLGDRSGTEVYRPHLGTTPVAASSALYAPRVLTAAVEVRGVVRGRSVPLVFVVWLLIGAVVAGSHHYFDNLGSVGAVLSAALAILLWPLILIGVHFNITS